MDINGSWSCLTLIAGTVCGIFLSVTYNHLIKEETEENAVLIKNFKEGIKEEIEKVLKKEIKEEIEKAFTKEIKEVTEKALRKGIKEGIEEIFKEGIKEFGKEFGKS